MHEFCQFFAASHHHFRFLHEFRPLRTQNSFLPPLPGPPAGRNPRSIGPTGALAAAPSPVRRYNAGARPVRRPAQSTCCSRGPSHHSAGPGSCGPLPGPPASGTPALCRDQPRPAGPRYWPSAGIGPAPQARATGALQATAGRCMRRLRFLPAGRLRRSAPLGGAAGEDIPFPAALQPGPP